MSTDINAVYPLSHIVKAMNGKMHRTTVIRMLEEAGIKFIVVGRNRYVPLSEIRRCFPTLWDSLVLANKFQDD